MTQQTTHFGTQEVPIQQKESLVRGVFDSVASRYDLMNDLMSGGLHRYWKNEMVAAIPRPANMKLLDLAGGTGDIAFRFMESYQSKAESRTTATAPKKGGQQADPAMSPRSGGSSRVQKDERGPIVKITDINAAMLAEGQKRAIDRNITQGLEWVEGNAEKLPFPDNHFDACTIAFGIRNVTRIPVALKDIHRVLKPGGKFLCLEFSQVQGNLLRKIYDEYSDHILPRVGKVVTGDYDSYEYLVESIRNFPTADRFAEMITEAGFSRAQYRRMTHGVVALHTGWKI